MPGWILALANLLFGWAIKAWQARGPSPVVVEAEKAGRLETALKTEESANAEITRATQAGAAADAVVADPGKLRQFEQTDPNNRDNARS